jgi:hypothetical protein
MTTCSSWADEAQRFESAVEEGMSDYTCIDVVREAQATVVAPAQSSTSFILPLGRPVLELLVEYYHHTGLRMDAPFSSWETCSALVPTTRRKCGGF